MTRPRLDFDAVVIGAGVVGLACAARLARELERVLVVERHPGPGRETSSRNSGVVHAGLYYPPGSLKARACAQGRRLLCAYCEERSIAFAKTGKLVVAVDEAELHALETLRRRGLANGAGELSLWSAEELRRREPALSGVAALFSPESGVVDAHGLVTSLAAEARERGADLAYGTTLTALAARADGGYDVVASTAGAESRVTTRLLVNVAGIAADAVAELAGLPVERLGLRQYLCKGDYFALSSDAPKPRCALVYPVPQGPGLGVHLTRDLGGRVLVGPDATFVTTEDLAVVEAKAERFAAAVARYLPGVEARHLRPDQAGLRARLAGPGVSFRDFEIVAESAHGLPGSVHLLGIESPGLTACLALADHVAAELGLSQEPPEASAT